LKERPKAVLRVDVDGEGGVYTGWDVREFLLVARLALYPQSVYTSYSDEE